MNINGLDVLKGFYGQQSVDDFMMDATDYLKAQVRRLDIVARYGKSGFGILLPYTGTNSVLVRDRLVKRLASWSATKFSAMGSVLVEIGHATFPENGRASKELLELAQPKERTVSAANGAHKEAA